MSSTTPHAAPDSQGLRPYLLILVFAAALRIVWAAVVPIVPISDSYAYDACARTLTSHNTFGFQPDQPMAFWPVGTSFAYSLVYRVFDPAGFGYAPIVAFNVVLGVLMVGLSMACAKRWFGWAPALITGLILGLWPTHIQFTTIMASETLFIDLCLAAMLAWPPRINVPRLVLAGVLLAAASYVRPTALLIPIALAGGDWLRSPRLAGIPRALASAGVALLVIAVAVAPWAARNHRLFGRTVLIATNGGSNLWMGNNPDTTGAYQGPPSPPGMNEAERDAYRGKLAREYIIGHPATFAKNTALKAAKLHASETIGTVWNLEGLRRVAPTLMADDTGWPVRILKAMSTGYWLLVLVLGVSGFVVLVRRAGLWQTLAHPAVVIWAYFTAVHAVIVIQDRYHLPATPMIAALAGLAIGQVWQRASKPNAT